jgi:hypothetical protein
MFLEIHLRIGSEDSTMSKRSETLAAYVHQALKQKPSDEAMLKRNGMLDEGFMKLKQNLKSEFESQIDDLRREPDCGNLLFASLSGESWEIKRLDDHDCVISVKFDSHKRSIAVKSEKPIVFTYFVEVHLNNNETSYYYQAGEKKKDLGQINERVAEYLADKCLCALFGVQKS